MHAELATATTLKAPALSAAAEQQLVECNGYGWSCSGGHSFDALNYIYRNNQTTESKYKYT